MALTKATYSMISGEVANVKDFGAKGDNSTNDIAAIQAAFDSGSPLFFPEGTYIVDGSLTLTATSSYNWTGVGAGTTIIKFTDSSISAGISRTNITGAHWYCKGMSFVGPGISAGSVTGIKSTRNGGSLSYNLFFEDVTVTDFSGDGLYIDDWFQQKYSSCGARNIGGNGIVSGGDQFTSFIGTGNFFLNVNGYCLWFFQGSPFIQGVNVGSSSNGMKFGLPSSHPYGARYCFPHIVGANFEYIKAGGTGIRFENSSIFSYMDAVSIYPDSSGAGATTHGIYIDYLGGETGFVGARGVRYLTPLGGTFTNKFFINNANPSLDGSIVSLQNLSSIITGSQSGRFAFINGNNGFNTTSEINCLGLVNSGKVQGASSNIITTSVDIDLQNSANDNVHTIFVDASGGNRIIDLPIATFPNGEYRELLIKKIDASANTVTLRTFGAETVDGVNDPVISTQWAFKKIISNDVQWLEIA